MASFINNKTLKLLDEKIDIYLVYLVHIQQSINLSLNEKLSAFNESDRIGNELNAITAKVMTGNINSYNEQDFEAFIDKTMEPLANRINSEIGKYDNKLRFNNKSIFSVKEIIQKLEEQKENTVSLTKDKIDRLLSYKVLYKGKKDEELEREINKEVDKVKKKLNDDFETVRFKTFKEMIKGIDHKNEDYLYKTNKYIIDNYLDRSIAFVSTKQETVKGIFFVQSKVNDIELFIDEENIRIEYNVAFLRSEDYTNLEITGFIKRNDSKVDFFINERYSNGYMDSVLNAYNLIPLINKYNDSYAKYFHDEVKGIDTEKEAKKEIDDFFSGKIC
jgi:hypothetical protein